MEISISNIVNFKFLKIKNRNIFIYCTLICAFTTYIFQNIFNLGEIVAEGLPLIFGFIYFLAIIKKNLPISIIPLTFYLIILIFFTQISIIMNDGSYYQYIFIYYYLPAYLLYCSSKKIIIDSDLIFKVITFMSIISSLFGIAQFFYPESYIPIDLGRARGLSRSTLNYSSLLFIGYIASDYANFRSKKFIKFVIFLGVICSLGRSAVLAILIYEFFKSSNKIKFIVYISIVIASFLLITKILISNGFDGLILLNQRFTDALNFTSNRANSERLEHGYLRILSEFTLIGKGLGSTGPASGRFYDGGTGFESFLLNIIYQGGIAFIIFMPFIIFFALQNFRFFNNKILAVIISYTTFMFGVQTFETPAVNITAWFLLIAILNLSLKKHKITKFRQ